MVVSKSHFCWKRNENWYSCDNESVTSKWHPQNPPTSFSDHKRISRNLKNCSFSTFSPTLHPTHCLFLQVVSSAPPVLVPETGWRTTCRGSTDGHWCGQVVCQGRRENFMKNSTYWFVWKMNVLQTNEIPNHFRKLIVFIKEIHGVVNNHPLQSKRASQKVPNIPVWGDYFTDMWEWESQAWWLLDGKSRLLLIWRGNY